MTPQQYTRAIKTLGLSKNGAGRFLGISPRHSHRLAAGVYVVPRNIEILLNLMVEHKISPADASGHIAAAVATAKPKSPRKK